MVWRLDPTIPLVWRDPTTVQLGVDPVIAVVPDVDEGLGRLIALLVAGVSESGYRMFAGTFRVPPRRADRLREALAPGFESAPPPERAARAIVLGEGWLARDLAAVLTRLDARTSEPADAALAVLVADRVIPPAEHRPWLSADVPHLPIVVGDTAIAIGPLVEPGITACLHCVGMHRRDADPAWPAIAAQLVGAAVAPRAAPVREAAAVALAAQLVIRRLDGARGAAGLEHVLRDDGAPPVTRSVLPHPACVCTTAAAPLHQATA